MVIVVSLSSLKAASVQISKNKRKPNSICCREMTEDCKHSDSNTGSTVTTLPKVAHTAEIGSLPGEKSLSCVTQVQ